MSFAREIMAGRLADLAIQGVYVGTSSWKYPGWRGLLYESARYEYRGKFSESRFHRHCLAEYGQVFKTVCVDAAYYGFPSRQSLERLAGQVPEDFLFGLKVTDAITIKRFPNLSRFGPRAGRPNETFLNAELFAKAFLEPCAAVRPAIGVLIFEFSRFGPADYRHGREFLADLDAFLGRLPPGWPYGVELRNRAWLRPEYFACLRRHRVAHVFNSWQAMPPVGEQMDLPESRTHPDLAAARFLLKPGRRYDEAVRTFQPYDRAREELPEARAAGRRLIAEGRARGPRARTFVFVNNRLEGNALETIAALV